MHRRGDLNSREPGLWAKTERALLKLTWNDVTGIHGILILNEAEAVHQLDLRDLSGAMGTEVCLDVGLGDFFRKMVSLAIREPDGGS